jgi:hypothetical protein
MVLQAGEAEGPSISGLYLREEPSRVGSIWPSVIWEVVMPLLVVVDEAPWACRKGGAPGGTDSGASDDSTPMASNWSTCLVERLAGK